MSEDWTISWVWWITAVEVPVLGCLFWLIHHGRRESEQALLQLYREIQGNLNIVLDNLAQSKLEAWEIDAQARRLASAAIGTGTRMGWTSSVGKPRRS